MPALIYTGTRKIHEAVKIDHANYCKKMITVKVIYAHVLTG